MFVRLFWSSVSYARKAKKLIARTIERIIVYYKIIFSHNAVTQILTNQSS